ncbi:ribosomal protection-like ABC-F family protein [Christensenella minuta]|uniref:ribosomal protection-like ABC-F family protein n=1 Tax=Christensenella minuta TaxID=626937 RepID=UPI002A81121C|nr:ABC-F type ribosomal protection protein [Christensenella minuta]MDY3750369.1 ABC-F type ribosomal protection protein [Christensenella minuta]
MSQISVNDLSFCYDGSCDMIFKHVSFQVDTDWKLGFTGRNGCGKTTFLKLLMGKYSYGGTISSAVKFEYFPFENADPWEFTGNVVSGICPAMEEWQISRELNLLEVRQDVLRRPFGTLSNGEQTKVLLAALFLKENSFLLLDEPTNHLDARARDTVAGYLRRKKGFILVSHDRNFLDLCVDHILAINRTNIELLNGNFSAWLTHKEKRDAYELERNNQLKKEVRRLSGTARQKAEWAEQAERSKKGQRVAGLRPDRGYIGRKAAKMMKRAKAAEVRTARAAEEKAKLLKNIERTDKVVVRPLAFHAQRLAELKDVRIRYGGKEICGPVGFSVERGERIALVGKNGSGKSSALKLISGEKIDHGGMLFTASGLVVSYVPQDPSFLKGPLDAYAEGSGIDRTLFLTLLRKLNFTREQFEKDMADFSAGQKKKVVLARSLAERAHLYIWDEPLNYIDVLSRMQIERLICECTPTMLFVEHDGAFVQNIADRFVSL